MQNFTKPQHSIGSFDLPNFANQSHTGSMSCLIASDSEACSKDIAASVGSTLELHSQGGLTGVPGGGRRTQAPHQIDTIALPS
jgi:hypothetical protein